MILLGLFPWVTPKTNGEIRNCNPIRAAKEERSDGLRRSGWQAPRLICACAKAAENVVSGALA